MIDLSGARVVDTHLHGWRTAELLDAAPSGFAERVTMLGMCVLTSGGDPATYDNSDTDSALSFFSAHSAQVSALSAAATYIAFSRSPHSVRPWITLGVGAALTTFVAYERVRSGNHFPTDVMAGALAGTSIGALIVHLHREDSVESRPVWIGMMPFDGGGVVSASGLF